MFRQFDGLWITEHLTTIFAQPTPAIRETRETDVFQTKKNKNNLQLSKKAIKTQNNL